MAVLGDLKQKDCREFEARQGYTAKPGFSKSDSNSNNNKTNKTQEDYFLTHLGRGNLGFQLRPGAPIGKRSGHRQRRARPSIVMNVQLQWEHLTLVI